MWKVFWTFLRNAQENSCVAVSFEADNVIKKGTVAQVFFCKFSKLFKNTYFEEHVLAAAV